MDNLLEHPNIAKFEVSGIEFVLEEFRGHSNKSGKDFDCFRLTIQDYQTLLFPQGNMERRYLLSIIKDIH